MDRYNQQKVSTVIMEQNTDNGPHGEPMTLLAFNARLVRLQGLSTDL